MSNETADLQMFNSALEKALVAKCDSQRAEIEQLTVERDEWKRLAKLAVTTQRAALAGKEG